MREYGIVFFNAVLSGRVNFQFGAAVLELNPLPAVGNCVVRLTA
jgi:hypothetical protein